MPSWLRSILLGVAEFAVERLGGRTYDQGYQEGFRAACAEQEKAVNEAKKRMDAVPDSPAAGKLRKRKF